MDWNTLDPIRDVAITLYRHGKTKAECAAICGCTEKDINRLFKKYGTGKHEYAKEQEPKAVELLKNGYTLKEVANKIGLSESWARDVASEHNISPMTEIRRERERLITIVRQYKAKGLTCEEVAKTLGVSIYVVRDYCVGISSQAVQPISEREENARKQIEARGFEYVSGYESSDGTVTIRCPKCGHEFERSMVTIRHHDAVICPQCVQNRRDQRAIQKLADRVRKEQARCIARQQKEAERQKEIEAKKHPCLVCGELTTNPKYCSKKCLNKVNNAAKEAKRRLKIKNAMVDRNITLERLYKRDRGVCYLCGEMCDWSDKEEREDAIICGDQYPSIDHVIPLAKGGEHSWQNVKLAHRKCNTEKRDSLLSTTSSPITSR